MGKLIAFIWLLVFQSAWAQNDHLIWAENQKLNWEDFVPLEKGRSQFVAESSCGLYYRMAQEGNQMRVSIYAYFVPEESWVVVGKESDNLLAHEQLHFDIAELWARKMRKAFAKYELPVSKFIDTKADKSMARDYERFFDEMMKMQHRYDDETAHGIIEKAQAEWEREVRKNLEALREFDGQSR